MDPGMIARMLAATPTPPSATSARANVRYLIAEDRTNGAIGQQLVISEDAVAKYTAFIFLRLGPCSPHRASLLARILKQWGPEGLRIPEAIDKEMMGAPETRTVLLESWAGGRPT
jgi:hypothetical protein